jgi:3-deoxy-D-manno-octulosonic-acid transferase
VRDLGPRLELVLVPHEPSDEALRRIDAACLAAMGERPRRWSELNSDSAPERPTGDSITGDSAVPMVVDAVGLLADLYLEADLAFVGGAFDATGLHSVIEPAAAGLPVLFGPVHDRREADELLAAGAAEVVREQDAADRIAALIADPARMRGMGAAARSYVQQNAGASEGGAELVSELVDRGLSRRSPSSP